MSHSTPVGRPGALARAAVQAKRRVAGTPGCLVHHRRLPAWPHEKLTRRGAVFVSDPQPIFYGGTDAVFEDGCGNLLNLDQD